MPKRQPPRGRRPPDKRSDAESPEPLRIIGGRFRGSKLRYEALSHDGALVTRPMKHRVREAIFNLVGVRAEGKHALDLFAGTGALGLEAVSRGAQRATLVERHIPTAEIVRENIRGLGVEADVEVKTTSAFLWIRRDMPGLDRGLPWLAFISPPYSFYVDRRDEMVGMIEAIVALAPTGSVLVVEADERFDFGLLPGGVREDRHSVGWDVREYPPAVVGLLEV